MTFIVIRDNDDFIFITVQQHRPSIGEKHISICDEKTACSLLDMFSQSHNDDKIGENIYNKSSKLTVDSIVSEIEITKSLYDAGLVSDDKCCCIV